MTNDIVATAIALINGPRNWGMGTSGSLSDLAGAAITRASKVKLASAEFESARQEVLRILRSPK